MVKIVAVVAALAAAVAPVAAKNCKTGLYYCGYVLLQRGDYYPQIVEALHDVGSPTDEKHVNHSLFHCDGGANGDIHRIKYCSNGCRNGGSGHSDYC